MYNLSAIYCQPIAPLLCPISFPVPLEPEHGIPFPGGHNQRSDMIYIHVTFTLFSAFPAMVIKLIFYCQEGLVSMQQVYG